MAGSNEDEPQIAANEKAWAVVRILLGLAQTIAAVVALSLIVQTGMNALSLGVVAVAGLLTTASMRLFGRSKNLPK